MVFMPLEDSSLSATLSPQERFEFTPVYTTGDDVPYLNDDNSAQAMSNEDKRASLANPFLLSIHYNR